MNRFLLSSSCRVSNGELSEEIKIGLINSVNHPICKNSSSPHSIQSLQPTELWLMQSVRRFSDMGSHPGTKIWHSRNSKTRTSERLTHDSKKAGRGLGQSNVLSYGARALGSSFLAP
ncbi:hypothetical protein O181_022011 [Austropuccinia psidii MF-1]|uniref:Uncharacterized protein n=1 Tax=Austropuccinia psidii MF-1 TaxID=1389203 RepID=A0A9Q3CC18_9BASI|nr:hypothetical protein [Austropuccinia psidii MF-1]